MMYDNAEFCNICDSEVCLSWTDTHGLAQCVKCGVPYVIYHYEGGVRVDKPRQIAINDDYIPIIRRYWQENNRPIPSGFSFAGGQEIASRDDAKCFNEWMKLNGGATDGQEPCES